MANNDYYNAYGSGYGNNVAANSSRPVYATEKGEQQLADHIAKAVSADESAPKQKHVRAVLTYLFLLITISASFIPTI